MECASQPAGPRCAGCVGFQTDSCQQSPRRPPHWLQAMLFEPDLCVQSRHHNLVAFHFELALMLRVIKAATTNGADRTQVKLAMRSLGGPGGQALCLPCLNTSPWCLRL